MMRTYPPSPRIFTHTCPLACLALLALLVPAIPSTAQPPGMGPSPVGTTEARQYSIRRSVRLSGSVEARRSSVVASEVAGLVVELVAREGARVVRGAPLARLRRTSLEQRLAARVADLTEALARLELANHTLERNRELFTSEVISRQILDDAISEQAAWQGRVDSLKAEIAQVQDDLTRSVVPAPFSGVVVAEHTEEGEWLGVGSPVVELLDLEVLEVALELPERYYAELQVGSSTRVSFEALPGVEIAGKINAIIPRADPNTRTFPVKVRFPNRGHLAAVGMLAQVEITVGDAYPALIVPKDAVVQKGEGRFVYRIGAESKVEQIPVTLGSAAGAWLEIQGPVAAGDRIVTRGNERLFPGMPVAPSPVEYPLP